jgi:hypothetical protein
LNPFFITCIEIIQKHICYFFKLKDQLKNEIAQVDNETPLRRYCHLLNQLLYFVEKNEVMEYFLENLKNE